MLPFWHDFIVPSLRAGRRVLVSAHGNSLRALVKHLDGISDEEIPGLNIPTGIPLVYELDDDLAAVDRYYLGDPEKAAAAARAVADQARAEALRAGPGGAPDNLPRGRPAVHTCGRGLRCWQAVALGGTRSVIDGIVIGIHVLLSLALIALILLHAGRGGGLADAFGGGMGPLSGLTGSTVVERNLDRITVSVGVLFAITTLVLVVRLS